MVDDSFLQLPALLEKAILVLKQTGDFVLAVSSCCGAENGPINPYPVSLSHTNC